MYHQLLHPWYTVQFICTGNKSIPSIPLWKLLTHSARIVLKNRQIDGLSHRAWLHCSVQESWWNVILLLNVREIFECRRQIGSRSFGSIWCWCAHENHRRNGLLSCLWLDERPHLSVLIQMSTTANMLKQSLWIWITLKALSFVSQDCSHVLQPSSSF